MPRLPTDHRLQQFSDSYVSCQAYLTEQSRTEKAGTAPNHSSSGCDGTHTGLHHSPNADRLGTKHHQKLIKQLNPCLEVDSSIWLKAYRHFSIRPTRKYRVERSPSLYYRKTFLGWGYYVRNNTALMGGNCRGSVLWCKTSINPCSVIMCEQDC